MDARKILENNYKCEQGSFIYYLHEEAKFEKASFWEYYDCISELGKLDISEKFTQQILTEVNYTYILKSILYHFAPNDGYVIIYFPKVNFNYYIERLECAIEAFYKGYDLNEIDFGNYIKWPK